MVGNFVGEEASMTENTESEPGRQTPTNPLVNTVEPPEGRTPGDLVTVVVVVRLELSQFHRQF